MKHIGHYLGIPKQSEVLLLTIIGIICTIFDASLFDLNTNLHKVWQAALDPSKVSGNSQIYIKYLLSGIILVRSFSVHLYLAFYVVMLWPAVFEERPALLLPWLTVGAIKCLGMGFMSLCTGMYTCFSYGIYRPACLDFVLAQVVDHTPSFYMWFCVLSYYRELKMCASVISIEQHEIEFESERTIRRRKVRSLADTIITHHCQIDENRHLISVSTIENFVHQYTTDLKRRNTRSLDSLLGIMAAEAEKEELMNVKDDTPLLDPGLSIPQRTAKMLKVTDDDICQARRNRRSRQDLVLFTNSMLQIQNISDGQPCLTKVNEKPASKGTYHLRPTQSDKVESINANMPKPIITEFMADISEIEIRNTFNYSSSSVVSLINDAPEAPPSKSNQKSENDKRLLEQSPNLTTDKILKQVALDLTRMKGKTVLKDNVQRRKFLFLKPVTEFPGKYAVEDVPEKLTKNDIIEIQIPATGEVSKKKRPRKSQHESNRKRFPKAIDFTCQASTLSRNVLMLPPGNGSNNNNKISHEKLYPTNKKSMKAQLIHLPTTDEETTKPNVENVKKSPVKDTVTDKVEILKNKSAFKRDGYTLAYLEKMKNNKLLEKTNNKRVVNKELKNQAVKSGNIYKSV